MVWSTHKPSNGAGKGDGWGGPAKGAGSGPAKPFTSGNATRVAFHAGHGDPAKAKMKRTLATEREARLAQLKDHLADLGLNADRQETQVSAIVAYLNREEGLPVAMNKNLNAEMTFEELVNASLKPREDPPG
jgi:hypothetical protein